MVPAESFAKDIDRQCRSSFPGLLKWFIAVVSVLLLSGLARSTAQGQTLLTGGGATFPHPIYAFMLDGLLSFKSFIQISRLNIMPLVPARVSEKLQRAFSISGRVTDRWMTLSSKNTVQSEAWRSCTSQLYWAQMYRPTTFLE